jgi:vacuole morphology and inheritance protein 14
LFPALLKLLSDPAEEVVRQDLAVMGIISTNPTYFDRLMQSLISLFATDPTLLEKRGTMIVRQLSLHLDAQRVFRRLSVILEESADEDFAVAMARHPLC